MQIFPPQPARLELADGATLAYHRSPGAAPGVVFLGGFTSDMTGIKATTLERWCRGRGRSMCKSGRPSPHQAPTVAPPNR